MRRKLMERQEGCIANPEKSKFVLGALRDELMLEVAQRSACVSTKEERHQNQTGLQSRSKLLLAQSLCAPENHVGTDFLIVSSYDMR